jgi:hypothetical protein
MVTFRITGPLPALLLALTTRLMAVGKVDDALRILGSLIARAPSAELYTRRAVFLRIHGDLAASRSDAERAISVDDSFAGAHLLLGEPLEADNPPTARWEYELGAATNVARGGGGSVAVRRLARALVVSETRLHVCARVVRAFPPDFPQQIRARRTSAGRPLSFEHFVQLSRVRDETMRGLFVERAIEELLTVEELRAEVDQVVEALGGRRATREQALRRATRMVCTIHRWLPMLVVVAHPGAAEEGEEAFRVIRLLRERAQDISDSLAAVLGGKDEDCLN